MELGASAAADPQILRTTGDKSKFNGPRATFGADVKQDGGSIVPWGSFSAGEEARKPALRSRYDQNQFSHDATTIRPKG